MITFSSIPVFNYSYLANALNPTSAAIWTDTFRNEPVWSRADWITYFNALNAKYGQAQAVEVWSYFWNAGLDSGVGGAGDLRAGSGLVYDSVPMSGIEADTDFHNFITKYNLSNVVYKGLGKLLAQPAGVVFDIGANIVDAATTTSKILKYGIPVLIIIGAGLLVWYGVKKVQSK